MTRQELPEPVLTWSPAGSLQVKGDLTFATAGGLLKAGAVFFRGRSDVILNLSGVTGVDSAGLALLLEWLRQASTEGRGVRLQAVPEKLLAIARLSGVEALLTQGVLPPSASVPSSGNGSSSSRS